MIEFTELRIGINNRRKQFTGICRDHLCNFQDGVQYQFPYPVRGGQLESVSCGLTEECSDGLVGLKSLHRTKYVILHHGQREAGNLRREVYALTSAEVEQLLAVVISHLGSPAVSVRPVRFEKTEREIRCEQSIPMPIPASLREEQTHSGSGKLHVDGAVGTSERSVMLGESLLLEFLDNPVGCKVSPPGMILGIAHLDHTYQVALDVAAGNQADEVCTGKPAVNEQIVESDAALDGVLHHLDGLFNLRHRVLPDAFLDSLSAMILAVSGFALLVRQPLLLGRLAALLAMKREIEEQLAHAIAQKQRQTFVAKDGLVLKVRENLADEFTLTSALWSVSVIDDKADWLVMLSLCAVADLTQQLEVHRIKQLAPLDVTIIHKTIEHVLLTTEQAA